MSRSRRSSRRSATSRRKSNYDEPIEDKSPTRKSASVDSKTVGIAGVGMFLMTNFKKEIGMILTAISKIIGGS